MLNEVKYTTAAAAVAAVICDKLMHSVVSLAAACKCNFLQTKAFYVAQVCAIITSNVSVHTGTTSNSDTYNEA